MSPETPTAMRPAGGGGSATPDRSRRSVLTILVTAVVVLVASVIAAPWIVHRLSGGPDVVVRATGGPGVGVMGRGGSGGSVMGGGMMGGGRVGMMSGRVWLAGDGRVVTSIAAARSRAAQASSSSSLHPGEIIQFRDNFYVELKDASGAPVTEVLVDPVSGAVTTEPGPAMMWNTGSRVASVSAERAKALAAQWLEANRSGEMVGLIDAYPGYYTADTVDATSGATVGMLSVNAMTGAVWYHTWHGGFIAKEDI
jgi:hypothetical protein